ncbi:MAG: T9SS type A sorting domain-containing protein [bacterium]|nr:T9SS type A sorting domain-containing protein [bacterium]
MIKTTGIPSCCSDGIALVGRMEDGSEFFRTYITGDPYTNYAGVCITSQKNLLAYGGTIMSGCDYGRAHFRVCTIDTLGITKWSFTTFKKVDQILPRTNSTFFMLATDSLYRFNHLGTLLSKLPTGLGGTISGAALLNNGNILISFMASGIPRFRIIDSTCAILLDNPVTANVNNLLQTPGGSIYGLSGGCLQKYSPSLNLLCTTATVLPVSYAVSAFFFRNDSLFAAGQDVLLKPSYLLFNNSLNLLNQSLSNLESFNCTGIYVSKKNVVKIVAWGSNTSFRHIYSGYFHTTIAGTLNGRKDVGVIRVVVTGDSLYSSTVWGNKVFGGIATANVTVKNFGSDTINNFRLNYVSFTGGTSFCLLGLCKRYERKIAPGDSVTVATGTFNIQQFNSSALNPDGTVNLSFCLSTTVPDAENDIDITNDAACGGVINEALGLKEESNSFSDLKVFPNPSSGTLTITNDKIINAIQIFDVCGRLQKNFVPNDQRIEINNCELQNGLYFIKIITEKGTASRKVVFTAE